MSVKSYLKFMLLGLVAATVALSCTREIGPAAGTGDGESAMVKLSVYTPSSSLPSVTRSNATVDESAVTRVKLIVLQLSGAEYRYRYMVDGQQIVRNSIDTDITTFNALLTSSDVPLKVLIVANYNDAFLPDNIVVDMDEHAVKRLLVDSFDHRMEGYLPLYGELEMAQLKADQPNAFSLTMLRAVARVDVNNTIDLDFSEDFALQSVYVYRANDKLNIVPDAAVMQTPGKMTVSAPTIPSTAGRYAAYSKDVEGPGDPSIVKTYLPESLSITDESRRTAEATCIVVGGFYADDTKPSYYRIDFDSGLEEHPFGQVLRNHKYIFNIMQVNGRGWPTPDEAAENEATAMMATMQVWDELTSEMWFYGNENYLGISSRRVVLNYFALSEKTETLQATVPFSIQPLDSNGKPTGKAITAAGDHFISDFYKVELRKDASDGRDVWRLVVTSLAENDTDAQYSGGFQVFTDWWTFDVEVVQECYKSQFEGRYVRILTITDLEGDLGTTDGEFTGTSGQATRKILENTDNFSMTGTVTIEGMVVYDLKNATIASESASEMYILEKVLRDIDVVHLPYRSSPSVKAAQLLVDWHTAKPNRVMIIGLDDDQTNANLRSYIYTVDPADAGSGTWKVNTTVRRMGRADHEPGMTDKFFYGPFGEVEYADMGMIKASPVGYNNGYDSETTAPLLNIREAGDNGGMMTHGVNIGHGLIYWGDSSITTNKGTAMSDEAAATGTVTTDFDRLMGNIWAWIVERVVMVSEDI